MSIAIKGLIRRLQENGLYRRILPEKDLTSKSVNGVATFVPAICKLELQYNIPRPGAGGDSVGMIDFINKRAQAIEDERPYIELVLERKSGPPKISAFYNNGTEETLEVPRWKPADINKVVQKLCNASTGGSRNNSAASNVIRGTGSKIDKLLPHWDAFHAEKRFRP